jgi:HEPN domain-containing protein
MNDSERKTIEGRIEKAANHLQAAKGHGASRYRSSEAVEAAQECVELSVKAVLSLLAVEYPPAHEWPAETKAFSEIARRLRERKLLEKLEEQGMSYSVPLPRLLMLLNFWARFYLTAKYGFETEQLAAAQDLFRSEDSVVAIQHAEERYRAASFLRDLPRDKLARLL